jgi:phosphoglycolate phosphatase
MKKHVELIFMDFDGTIADSIPAAVEAVQEMLKELGYPPKTKEEIGVFVGFGETPLISGSIGTNDPQKLEKAMQVYEKQVAKKFHKVKTYPNINEFLEYFKSKKKIVLSSKKDAFIHEILKLLGIDKYFIEVVGGDTAECLKPNPYMIHKLMETYGAKSQETLMIGDMTIDMETGKNAKILTCGVSYGFDGREKLAKYSPDFLVDNILDLVDLTD